MLLELFHFILNPEQRRVFQLVIERAAGARGLMWATLWAKRRAAVVTAEQVVYGLLKELNKEGSDEC
jgi:hypothetical protein